MDQQNRSSLVLKEPSSFLVHHDKMHIFGMPPELGLLSMLNIKSDLHSDLNSEERNAEPQKMIAMLMKYQHKIEA